MLCTRHARHCDRGWEARGVCTPVQAEDLQVASDLKNQVEALVGLIGWQWQDVGLHPIRVKVLQYRQTIAYTTACQAPAAFRPPAGMIEGTAAISRHFKPSAATCYQQPLLLLTCSGVHEYIWQAQHFLGPGMRLSTACMRTCVRWDGCAHAPDARRGRRCETHYCP